MKSLFSIAAFVLLFVSVSCKGPQGDVGPQGPPGPDYDPYLHEGYFKGTASGIRLDGTPFTYEIDFRGQSAMSNYYSLLSDSVTEVAIFNRYSGEGEEMLDGWINFRFKVRSLNDLSDPQSTAFQVLFNKKTAGDTVHNVTYSSLSSGSVLPVIYNLQYDKDTGIMNGNFSIHTTDPLATLSIPDGSFSATIKRKL